MCFDLLKNFVNEEILRKGRILHFSSIVEHYRKLQEINGREPKGCINKNVKARLINKFGNDLTCFSKTEKSAEIV